MDAFRIKTIGVRKDLIEEYRIKNNLTVEEFCRKCNILSASYKKMFKKWDNFYIINVYKIAEVMNVPTSDLFEFEIIENY